MLLVCQGMEKGKHVMKFKAQNIRRLLRDGSSTGQRAKTLHYLQKQKFSNKASCTSRNYVARSWYLLIATIAFSDNFVAGKKKKHFLILYIYAQIINAINIFSSKLF